MDRMPGGELQTIRDGLGLTQEDLATLLGVRDETVRFWERGKDPIPYRVPDEIAKIEAYTADVVTHVIEQLNDAPDAMIAVYRGDEEFAAHRPDLAEQGYTPRWWRHVVYRVAHEVPGLIIGNPNELRTIVDELTEADAK